MGICGWLAFGFLAGLLARAVTPGKQGMGFIATTLLGIAGSFVGGAVATLLRGGSFYVLRPAGFIGAVVGAVILLVLGTALSKRG